MSRRMQRFKQKIRWWILRVTGIQEQIDYAIDKVEDLTKLIGDRTTVHADIHYKQKSMIIVVGEYKGKDYVECFHVPPQEIHVTIDRMRQMQRYAGVGRWDNPMMMPLKAVYKHRTF